MVGDSASAAVALYKCMKRVELQALRNREKKLMTYIKPAFTRGNGGWVRGYVNTEGNLR